MGSQERSGEVLESQLAQEANSALAAPSKSVPEDASSNKQALAQGLDAPQEKVQQIANPPKNEKQRRRREWDEQGRLALTHRRPDFVLPELPADVHPTPSDFLEEESTRIKCPGCGYKRSLFCYDCLRVLTDRRKVPTVELPFHVHILLHGMEKRSAATSIHAALLAPGQVTIYEGDSFSQPFDPATSAVLFPSSKAVPVSELSLDRLENILLIDSKWRKANVLIEDPLLQGLPHVRLEPVKTAFWRYHTKNVTEEGVSTIEAVYYLCKQRHKDAHDGDSSKCHCYDDLLFYFAHIYRRIRRTGSES